MPQGLESFVTDPEKLEENFLDPTRILPHKSGWHDLIFDTENIGIINANLIPLINLFSSVLVTNDEDKSLLRR